MFLIIGTKIISISSIFEILLPFATSFHFMKLMCLRRRTLHSQWFTVLTDVWNDLMHHPLRPWLSVLHVLPADLQTAAQQSYQKNLLQ